MMLKALFWDNDGVLVDTERLYLQACREALEKVGVALPREQFVQISLAQGESVFNLVEGLEQEALESLRSWRNQRYEELLKAGNLVIPGVEAALRKLQGRLLMGVATGSRGDHFQVIHSTTGLLPYFDFVLVREDYKNAKPEPDAYLTAMEQHGLDPEECLVIEDSERGMKAALAANIRCIVVPNELTAGSNFSGAYKIVNDLNDVVTTVRGILEEKED